jgi:uncharacterized alpha-E superfamily protein
MSMFQSQGLGFQVQSMGWERGAGVAGSVRPMLARVADAMYWMCRYVERAEHVSRMLLETGTLLTDVGDLAPALRREYWRAVLRVLGLDGGERADSLLQGSDESVAQQVCAYMTFDALNRSSLLSCVTCARENARSVRENISGEMWENLNTLYWSLQGDDGRTRFDESPQEFYRQVLLGTMLFEGLTDQTLAHGQGWMFTQIGKHLERLDLVCRTIGTVAPLLDREDVAADAAERNIHFMSLLRVCASLEAYRRIHVGDMDPASVVAFLVLERSFPRSIRYCVHHAHDAALRVRAEIDPHTVDQAVRVLGRLNTQLEYADVAEIERAGLGPYLLQIRITAGEAAEALRKAYFLH